ncbi:MAG: hypothetical protein GZ091_08320 [Paludibacter sp.]|nr:hypothetical protein [Paludibacter sp.]
MALLKQLDIITGSLGKVTLYKHNGSDKIFMRTKGGASKEKIKQSPAFANVHLFGTQAFQKSYILHREMTNPSSRIVIVFNQPVILTLLVLFGILFA